MSGESMQLAHLHSQDLLRLSYTRVGSAVHLAQHVRWIWPYVYMYRDRCSMGGGGLGRDSKEWNGARASHPFRPNNPKQGNPTMLTAKKKGKITPEISVLMIQQC